MDKIVPREHPSHGQNHLRANAACSHVLSRSVSTSRPAPVGLSWSARHLSACASHAHSVLIVVISYHHRHHIVNANCNHRMAHLLVYKHAQRCHRRNRDGAPYVRRRAFVAACDCASNLLRCRRMRGMRSRLRENVHASRAIGLSEPRPASEGETNPTRWPRQRSSCVRVTPRPNPLLTAPAHLLNRKPPPLLHR